MDVFDDSLICCFIFGCCDESDSYYNNINNITSVRNNRNTYMVVYEKPITDETASTYINSDISTNENTSSNEHMKRE